MKKLFIGLALLIVLLIAAVIFLPSLVPASAYKDKIEARLSESLGRDVSIKGDIKLATFPVVKAQTGRIEIANPAGFSAPHFITIDGMDARIKLLPLLSKRVEIKAFDLTNPVINLEKLRTGQANWVIGEANPSEVKADKGPFKRDGRYADLDSSIGRFILRDGQITYSDQQKSKSHKLDAVNIDFALPSLGHKLEIDGSLNYNGLPVDMDAKLDSPRAFLKGESTPLSLKAVTDFATIDATGAFRASQDMDLDVTMNSDLSSLSKLTSLIPVKLPAYIEQLSSAKLSGDYSYVGGKITAKNADISAISKYFKAGFKGNADLRNTPILDGALNFDGSNLPALARSFNQNIKGIELLDTAKITADFNSKDKGFNASNIDATLGGKTLNLNYKGSANVDNEISSKGQFKANLSDLNAVISALDIDMEQAGVLNQILGNVTASGDLDFTPNNTQIRGLNATLSGGALTGSYNGSIDLPKGGTPKIDGQFNADVSSAPSLAELTGLKLDPLKALGGIKAQGGIKMLGNDVNISGLTTDLIGGSISGNFSGDVSLAIGGKPNISGSFDTVIPSAPELAKIAGLSISQIEALGTVNAKGIMTMQGDTLNVKGLEAKLSGGALSGNFNGDVSLPKGGKPDISGSYNTTIPSAAELNTKAGLGIAQLNGLGQINSQGAISMSGDNLSINSRDTRISSPALDASYTGDINYNSALKEPGFKGSYTANIHSLSEFSKLTDKEIPYQDAIGKLALSGVVSGQGKSVELSQIDAKLTEGHLNGTYTGAASMRNGFALNGDLSADIPSLRNLAQVTGSTTTLPPSTDKGAIYERFAVTGKVQGAPDKITFNNANINLDHLSGIGDFTVDLTRAKPFASGTLNMPELDLRPYMAAYSAQKPVGQIQPWNEQPFNAGALKVIDGAFKVNTPNIITDRMTLDQANMDIDLSGGVMTTNIPDMALYGGRGFANVVIDARSPQTAVAFKSGLNAVQSNRFLKAVAGFAKATGQGKTLIDVKGQGRSQAEIMRSLNGQGDFSVTDGQISGVDLTQLLTGLDQAFSARAIPSGVGPNHLTKFEDIAGLFKIQNGVVSIDNFALNAAGVQAQGGGQIDLGQQNIDFFLRPRLTGQTTSKLGNMGIPIRMSGKFGQTQIGLDQSFLGDIIKARAQEEATKLLQDQIGGNLGGALGGLLGNQQTSPTATNAGSGNTPDVGSVLGGFIGGQTQQPQTQQPQTQTQPQAQPQAAPAQARPITQEEAIIGALGGLLGTPQPRAQPAPTQPTQPQPTQAQPTETAPAATPRKAPTAEDAILDIFGIKR